MLKPFEEATEAISSKGSSAALTIPVVNSLVHFLDTTADEDDVGVRNMKRKILSSFHSRFSGMETNKLYTLPMLLDPRFKGQVFHYQQL